MRLVHLGWALLVAAVLAVACGGSNVAVIDSQLEGGAPDQVPNPVGLTDAGGGIDSAIDPPGPNLSIGGYVTGLRGAGLVLQNNGGETLTVGADGLFSFRTRLAEGASFLVTIKNQPTDPQQTCDVSAEAGTVASGNVTSVLVNCATNAFSIGGRVSGRSGTPLVLQNNAGDDLVISSDGSFAFRTPVLIDSTYAVTVKTQPTQPSQTCVVTNAAGTIRATKVTDIDIACTTNTYSIEVTVSGVVGVGLSLRNGPDALNVNANGPFAFRTPVASGGSYNVTVARQPTIPSQTCVVTNGTGMVVASDVTTPTVACTTNTYLIGGTVSGLAGGESVVLQNNGANNVSVAANGNFTFTTPIASGANYAVTILTPPRGKVCTLTNGAGAVIGAPITNVTVACSVATGTVRDIAGGVLPVRYTLCGDGTSASCTLAAAQTACTALGLKLVSHAWTEHRPSPHSARQRHATSRSPTSRHPTPRWRRPVVAW